MVKDGGGGKLDNARKVLVLQILAGVQAAAGQDGKLDAGGQEVFIAYLQIEIVQFFQKAVPHIIAQVLQVVPVNLAHGAFRLLHERPANVTFLRGSILPFQRLRNSAGFFRRHFPQVGCFRPTNGPGVRYVIDIPQFGLAPRVFCNQGNPRGPGLDPAAHGIVPQLHLRTGGSVRALRVDQQLLIKTVFLKMLSRGNVRFILIEACSLSFPLLVSRLSCRAQGTATVTVLILILQVGTIQPLEYLYLQQVTAGPDGFGILFPLKTSGFSF